MELTTTFQAARAAKACTRSYRKMARALGGVGEYGEDRPFPLLRVLEVLGFGDTLWAFRCAQPRELAEQISRLLPCDYAEMVLPAFEADNPDDRRPREAIETARRFAFGLASSEELAVAEVAAGDAAWIVAVPDAWAAAADARVARLRFALEHPAEFIAEHRALISK